MGCNYLHIGSDYPGAYRRKKEGYKAQVGIHPYEPDKWVYPFHCPHSCMPGSSDWKKSIEEKELK
jgi:hypothetical protein